MDVGDYLDGRKTLVADGGAETQYSCDHCGEHVQPDFYRVFSTDDGLYACTNCSPNEGIAETQLERVSDGDYSPPTRA